MDPEEEARRAALPTLTRREVRLAAQYRATTPDSYDSEARTVEFTAATGTPVLRFSWLRGEYYWEVLEISEAAIDLSRISQGVCPLLDSHSRWSVADQLGLVQSGRIEPGKLVLSVKFGESEAARAAEADVAAGTLKASSIGYRITELTLTSHKEGEHPVYTATRWELLENSLCPVPADPAAGVRSEDGLHPCVIIQPKETRSMDPEEEARAAEAAALAARNRANPPAAPAAAPAPADPARAAPVVPDASAARMTAGQAIDFVEDARLFNVDVATARTWADTLTPDAARAELLRAAATAQRAEAPPLAAGEAARVTVDGRDTARMAISAALALRINPNGKLDEGVREGEAVIPHATQVSAAREYRGMTLMEIARHNLVANGERVSGLNKRELADLAFRQHSTSDFPNILSNVANKTLRSAYTEQPQTFKRWQRRATASDFKQITRIQMGAAPQLLLVPEGGEYKAGTIGEGKEVYALATYGRKFSMTRQMLINDDLDGFSRLAQLFGASAARFESDAAYAPLIANPNMGDGIALFHASHGNLAGAGAAIGETSLQAGEIAIGNQTGLQGEILNLTPKTLIVARKDRVTAQKLLTGIQATATGDVNVYANSMDLVVESRLNRSSGATPWFMAADSSQVDTIEYAYLEGEEGMYTEERMGFDVDGMDIKVRLDFATKAIDWRGLFMNPGT